MMKREIKFFKKNGNWYADIPNHTLDENEMVMGSDILLESFSEGHDELIIYISDKYIEEYILSLTMIQHDDDGAFYKIDKRDDEIWICNVTHDVFGEHPEKLYIILLIF